MAENNGSTLKVLSWNIDDLDAKNLDERTQGVLEIILKKKPDVVLLQEVIEDSLDVFKNECVGYVQ
jgi:exonuclease III